MSVVAEISGVQIGENKSTPLWEKAVLLDVSFSMPGNTKKLSNSMVETEVDKTMMGLNKKLLDCPEVQALNSLQGEIGTWIRNRSLPGPFKSGIYLQPIASLAETDEQLKIFASRFDNLADAIPPVLKSYQDDAEKRLGPAYDPRDYLSPDEYRSRCRMAWKYLQLGVPGALKTVSESLWKNEQSKLQALWADAQTEVTTALRAGFVSLVERLAESLKPREDGSQRKFYDTSVTNLTDFMQTFDARNIACDADLETLVCKARALLNGVSPEQVRKAADVRQSITGGIAAIAKDLKDLTTAIPTRKIR